MGKLPVALAPTRTVLSSTTYSSTTSTSITASSSSSSSTATTIYRAPSFRHHQLRHANFIARPRRPYTFTQLVTLSDGSAFTMRTTSPNPLYRSSKDTRNTLLWQPSEKSLKNVELDEAGRLAAFRSRFGRGFDAASQETPGAGDAAAPGAAAAAEADAEAEDAMSDDSFADLIAGYAPQDTSALKGAAEKKSAGRKK